MRKTEVVFWGEAKIKNGLVKLMELNLIPYETSDTSAIYLKKRHPIHQLLGILFSSHTKYTCSVFRLIAGYGCSNS